MASGQLSPTQKVQMQPVLLSASTGTGYYGHVPITTVWPRTSIHSALPYWFQWPHTAGQHSSHLWKLHHCLTFTQTQNKIALWNRVTTSLDGNSTELVQWSQIRYNKYSIFACKFHYKLTDSTGNYGLPHTHTVSYPRPGWSFRLPNMAALYGNHSTLTVKQSQANCLTTRLATPSKRIYFPVSPLDGSLVALNSMKMD